MQGDTELTVALWTLERQVRSGGRGLPNHSPNSDLTVVPSSCSVAQGAKGVGQWLDEMLLVSGDVRPHRMLSPLTGALISGFGNSPTSWSPNILLAFCNCP